MPSRLRFLFFFRGVFLSRRQTRHVMLPNGKGTLALRDWDLWGPLLMSFLLAVVVGLSADAANDKSLMFAVVFVIVAGGSLIVTFNAKVRASFCVRVARA